MPETQGHSPSDEAELTRLCSALHLDAPVVRRFVADYLRLLHYRIDRIDHDLEIGDVPAAVVGLLSLSTSSSMVGALGVADAAERLRLQAASGDLRAVTDGQAKLVAQVELAEPRLARINTVVDQGASR
jgi:hypothetical protein